MSYTKKDVERLRNDQDYYGEFGRQFISNSSIRNLVHDPRQFKVKQETTLPMLHGRYLHTALLEPEKLDSFLVVPAASRNTKVYKEMRGDESEPLLLQKEQDQLDILIQIIKDNWGDEIYADGVLYEEPAIGDIGGNLWKGKADILIPGKKIIDIKTSADLTKFNRSARNYNYDSQAYVYEKLFGVPVEYYVIDKETGFCTVARCSDDFLEWGAEKVAKANRMYDRFYGPNRTDDPDKYIPEILL